MDDTLPDPLVPTDADLTSFKFMPLEIARLRKSKSWLVAKRSPEIGFYMINLWCAAWHETPAGSLEDDDDVLADFAMCDPKKWERVKERVMRGWVKCADGKLYHPVVSEKVIEAIGRKDERRQRTEAARAAAKAARQAKSEASTTAATKIAATSVTDIPTDDVTASNRQGQGEGQGQGDSKERRSPSETVADAGASGAVGEEGDDPEDLAWCQSPDAVALLTLSGKYNPHHARATLREWVRLHGPTVTRQQVVAAQTVGATDPLTYAAKRLANLRAQDAAGVRRGQAASTPDEPWKRHNLTQAEWEAL